MNFPSSQPLKRFLKQTFQIGLVLSLTVYAWLRIIFFEVPFSISEDGSIIIKTVLFGWFMIILLKAAWLFILFVVEKIETLRAKKRRHRIDMGQPLISPATIFDNVIMPQ